MQTFRFNPWRYLAALLLAGGLSLTACDDDDENPAADPVTTFGDATAVGNGSARSFVTVDASGNPAEIGLRLTEAGLTGLPAGSSGPPPWYVLNLPANTAKLPFNHISLDWAVQGHEPPGVYNTPHFDVHFYMATMAERTQIAPNDSRGEVLPEARLLPPGYVAGPGVVPMMGKHWTDPAGHEFHGMPFTQTFVVGSFNGAVTFWEPMIDKAYLESKKTETFGLPQPQTYAKSGVYFPTKYTIGYDASTREYVVKMHDMVLR